MSSVVTRLNIPFMHSQKSWIENIRMIVYWSRDPGLVSDEITNIERRIE